MMRENYVRHLALALAVGLVLLCLHARAHEVKPEALYFFENYCDSCSPETEFLEEFRYLTGREAGEYRFTGHNVAGERAKALLTEIWDRLQVPEDQRLLPFLVLGDAWYAGTQQIQTTLPRDFVVGDSTTSLLYYLYVTACESCAQAKAALDALPETVEVTRGNYTFDSPVRITSVNIGDDPGLAQSLFDRYHVPQDKRVAPIVFLRDTFLSGAVSIERSLSFRLGRGEAVGTMVAAPDGVDTSVLSILGTIGAGLVGGLNPCALGMLLFFLTVILSMNRKVGALAGVYLATKFVVYLLIGTVFYGVFRVWNPQWLPMVLKVVLTVIGVALLTLNVLDALAVRRRDHAHVRNQLPQATRRFLHDRMRSMLTGGGRALWISAIIVAALVAAVEFLCAGQVYLATLLAGIQSGARPARMYTMLVVYCLAFLTPAALLAFVAARGKSLPRLAAWLDDHMEMTKWLTAVLFLIVIVTIWL